MNALIHLVAIFLVIAFTWWFLDQGTAIATLTGVGFIGVTLLLIAWLLQAIVEDIGDLRSSRRRGKR